jgi:hypothetical protein
MAVTRIKNNQITDSTITYVKLAPGTLVGSVFNANLTLNSNVTILGNLTVANSFAQLNSINTYINDPLVVFNNNYVGSPSYDIGMLVNRNLSSLSPWGSVNAAFVWKEADSAFETIMTTETGTTAGSINNSGFANFKSGNVTANSASIIDSTASTSSTTGALKVTGGTGIGGALYVGGVHVNTGNVVAASGTASTNTTTGALVVVGGAGISGAIYAGSVQNTPIGSTTASTGAFTTLTSSGTTIASGNIVAASGTASTDTTTGALVVVGGIGASGAIYAGSVQNTPIGSTTASTGAFTTLTAGGLQAQAIGNVTPGTGAFTTLTTTGTFIPAGNIVAASGTASSSTTTGALVVVGGAGISGALNVGGTSSHTGAATFGSTLTASGNIVAASGTSSSNTTTGALVVVGGAGVSGAVNIGGATKVTDSTVSTSASTGALVVTGGVGVGGSLNVTGGAVIGGNLTVNGTVEYVNSTVTAVVDPILELNTGANGAPLASNVQYFGGIRPHFWNSTISGDSSAFFGRNPTSGHFEYYELVTGETNNVITGVRGTVYSGEVIAANTTAATSTFTGALRSFGGAGIEGNLWVAGGINGVIGNATPNTGAFTTLTTTGTFISGGNIVAASGTTSTSTTTGALVVTGGLGISGNIVTGKEVLVGNTLTVTGTTTLDSTLSVAQAATFSQTGVFTGNLVAASPTENTGIGIGALVVASGGASIAGNTYIGNNLYIGSGSYNVSVGTPTIIATDNGVNFAQIALKNTNSYGSADYAAYSDLGSDAGGWVDMGVAGSAFNDGNYTITKPHDGYLFTKPTDNSYGGNLVISTSELGSYKDVIIGSGSFHANAEVARFHGNTSNNGTFIVKLPTANNNTANTGAFQVWGGTSISGNTYHGGSTILNGSQTAGYDTIIRGKNDATLLWARPSSTYDAVIIGNSAVQANVVTGAKLQVYTTDSILLPAGTSAQRPGSAGGTDTVGMFRYNTTLGAIEYYGGSTAQWNLVSSQFTIIAVDTFSGDGSTVAFTMAGSNTTAGVIVAVNGIVQQPTVAYSVSGTTLTFTEAPAIGDTIDVRRMTTTQTVTGIASVNGYMQMQVDNDGAYIYTGSSSTTATTKWDTSGGEVSLIPNVSVASANTVTTLDSFSSDAYRTAKYIIQVKNGANYQSQEVLVVTDGTTATQVTYGVVQTSGNLGVVAASQSGSTTTLSFIATNATNTVRIKKDYIAI